MHHLELINQWQSKSELRDIYNKSKLYLLLSLKEGGNRAAREALLCNVPVVVVKGTAAEEFHINEHTGKSVESNTTVISKTVVEILDNIEQYETRNYLQTNNVRKKAYQRLWQAANNIQEYPGYPDIDKACVIRKKYTDKPLDNYLDLNGYDGRWPRLDSIDKEIAEIRKKYSHFVSC